MQPTINNNNIEILPMTFDDLDDVLGIEKLSYSSPWPRSQFEKELKNQLSNKFTAKIAHNGKKSVAAYIIFWVVANEAHILNIATHPDFRRRGIAKRFLVFALGRLEEAGVEEVFLEVRRSNIHAQRLYMGFGFKEIGIRKGYYGDNNEDAIVMALELEQSPKTDFEEKG
ncbi:MAG: ribosomal protein S18-alanine N-acetyltransferase [Deltaproteobacteria bacterium]|nr:ribosomal protein S18-alanine N-acetyltransferase [Deltaproteobacteria bacterium]